MGIHTQVVFLSCATNNRSETVYKEFKRTTEEFGVPREHSCMPFHGGIPRT